MIGLLLTLAITFHRVTVAQLSTTYHTHVTVCGTVTRVTAEADGDVHVRLSDRGRFAILEIIPALPLQSPPRGQRICASGISRIDPAHRWAEVHPVLQWVIQ